MVKLSGRFPNFELDDFQIMPEHMHGIIKLVHASLAVAQIDAISQYDVDIWAGVNPATTISDIVGAYKSLVENGCLEIYKTKNVTMGKLLQHNYYEHIKRDEQSYHNISNYVKNNPVKWTIDKYNKKSNTHTSYT